MDGFIAPADGLLAPKFETPACKHVCTWTGTVRAVVSVFSAHRQSLEGAFLPPLPVSTVRTVELVLLLEGFLPTQATPANPKNANILHIVSIAKYRLPPTALHLKKGNPPMPEGFFASYFFDRSSSSRSSICDST
jgi:hypothetical protein